jgi:hypothetical protein
MNEDDEGIRFHTLPRRCIVVVEFRRRRGRRRLCSWAAALGIRGGLQGEGVAQLQGVPRRAGGQGKGAALLMAAALHKAGRRGGDGCAGVRRAAALLVERTGTGAGPRRARAAQQQVEGLVAVLQEAHVRRWLRRGGIRGGTGAPGGRVQHQGGTQAGRVHRGRATVEL